MVVSGQKFSCQKILLTKRKEKRKNWFDAPNWTGSFLFYMSLFLSKMHPRSVFNEEPDFNRLAEEYESFKKL